MKKSQNYYVYTHSTATRGIFYVGKANETRIKFIDRAHNPHHTNIVKKYGKENIIVKTMLCRSEQHALDLEVKMIAALRQGGAKLVNLTDGGDGTSGRIASPETREKQSTSMKNKYDKNPMSQEIRNKKSVSQKKAMESVEFRERQSILIKATKSTIESRERNSIAQKKRYENIEERRKASQRTTDYHRKKASQGTSAFANNEITLNTEK